MGTVPGYRESAQAQQMEDLSLQSALAEGRGTTILLNDQQKQRYQDSMDRRMAEYFVNPVARVGLNVGKKYSEWVEEYPTLQYASPVFRVGGLTAAGFLSPVPGGASFGFANGVRLELGAYATNYVVGDQISEAVNFGTEALSHRFQANKYVDEGTAKSAAGTLLFSSLYLMDVKGTMHQIQSLGSKVKPTVHSNAPVEVYNLSKTGRTPEAVATEYHKMDKVIKHQGTAVESVQPVQKVKFETTGAATVEHTELKLKDSTKKIESAAEMDYHATHDTSFTPTKDQPWNIKEGQEWKEKIYGKAQKGKPGVSDGHDTRSYREAIKDAKNPNVEKVYLNQGMNKVLGAKKGDPNYTTPNRRPDVTTITEDGRIHQIEVPSATDKIPELRARMEDTKIKGTVKLMTSSRKKVIILNFRRQEVFGQLHPKLISLL